VNDATPAGASFRSTLPPTSISSAPGAARKASNSIASRGASPPCAASPPSTRGPL